MSASRERTVVEDQERGTAPIVTVAHVLSAWEKKAGKGKWETGERAGDGKRETGNREHETGNGITRHTIAKRVAKGVKTPNECPTQSGRGHEEVEDQYWNSCSHTLDAKRVGGFSNSFEYYPVWY